MKLTRYVILPFQHNLTHLLRATKGNPWESPELKAERTTLSTIRDPVPWLYYLKLLKIRTKRLILKPLT